MPKPKRDPIMKWDGKKLTKVALPKTPKKRKRVYRFEVWQDGMCVAYVESRKKCFAKREACHYANIYSTDGPVEIKELP